MPFRFEKCEIQGLILVTPFSFEDARGWFSETYKYEDFHKEGIIFNFNQDNHSYSIKNVLRGLHYQKSPLPQGKLVRCIRGSVLDVAVDLRPDSPTFKKWKSVVLDTLENKMFWIPEGFAHGFLTLSDEAEITYKCTLSYNSSLDAGIRWNDPDLSIDWGIKDPLLSEKDKNLPFLKDVFK